jgi:hypothetical protein
MGGSVGSAPGCHGSSLVANPDISQKYVQIGRHSSPPEKYTEKTYPLPYVPYWYRTHFSHVQLIGEGLSSCGSIPALVESREIE